MQAARRSCVTAGGDRLMAHAPGHQGGRSIRVNFAVSLIAAVAAWGPCLLVRLQKERISEVQVLVEVGLNFVTERNCVAARRGGEQREVNGQSVG
jgi:hypothetical protein